LPASKETAISFDLIAMALLVSCDRDVRIAIELSNDLPRLKLWLHLLALQVSFELTRLAVDRRLRSVRPFDRYEVVEELKSHAIQRREAAEIMFLTGVGGSGTSPIPEAELLVQQLCWAELSSWAKFASTIGTSIVWKSPSSSKPILAMVLSGLRGKLCHLALG
jgi:hypothetical protein